LGACAGPATAKGTIQVYVTDAPPEGVTAIEIKASNVEAHMSGAPDDQWVTLLKDPPVFDLVKTIGVNYLIGTSDIAAGKYTQVRLDITEVTVTINGKQLKATVPSDKIKLVGEIIIEEGKKTSISLDFDAAKSIVLEGQDKISLKPVVKLIVAKPGEALENTGG
jgi:predicted thioesterase